MRFVTDELFVNPVGFFEMRVDCCDCLVSVFVIFDRIDCTAGPRGDSVVELGVLAESTGVAQEWVFLVVVDRPDR